tara:strand:+ start:294 stop:725 length:432 start_codon:yes stop_codon:yes gene_type:complete
MECVICFEKIPKVSLKPCNHEMCEKCIVTYVKRFSTCPVCRVTIHACDPLFKTNKKTRDIILIKDIGQKLGIVIANEIDGVVVTNVEYGSVAMTYGLKKKDKILALNGIPCPSKEILSQICNVLSVIIFTIECTSPFSLFNIN